LHHRTAQVIGRFNTPASYEHGRHAVVDTFKRKLANEQFSETEESSFSSAICVRYVTAYAVVFSTQVRKR